MPCRHWQSGIALPPRSVVYDDPGHSRLRLPPRLGVNARGSVGVQASALPNAKAAPKGAALWLQMIAAQNSPHKPGSHSCRFHGRLTGTAVVISTTLLLSVPASPLKGPNEQATIPVAVSILGWQVVVSKVRLSLYGVH